MAATQQEQLDALKSALSFAQNGRGGKCFTKVIINKIYSTLNKNYFFEIQMTNYLLIIENKLQIKTVRLFHTNQNSKNFVMTNSDKHGANYDHILFVVI